ncbi:hypothetical protein Q8F55_005644 [Vanrija albida]|uniref:AMP-dependent synthetase/ligase domain-containing protein n=1 Tax=Vanrija albida TaxID=181172 RepID=A0ABR3Q2F4_9TREE
MPAWELDNLSLALLGLLAVLALYHRFFAKPAPLVHTLLLGRQAEPSKVRQPGQSAVYRSWATGQDTPLQVRPANQLQTVDNVVTVPVPTPLPGKPKFQITQRVILDTPLTTEALAEVVRLVPLGLKALFPGLSGTKASPTPILTLLPPSPGTALPLLLLSLASKPGAPLVVVPDPSLLDAALTSTAYPRPALLVVHESVFPQVVTRAANILIVGDTERKHAAVAKAASATVRWWEEIWDAAEAAPEPAGEEKTTYSDVHSYFFSLPEAGEKPHVVKVTHMNATAGIAGLLSIFPADKRPAGYNNDVVASAVRIDTPFGMTIALAAVWSGAGLRLIGSPVPSWKATADEDIAGELAAVTSGDQPAPTVLFLTAKHHRALVTHLQAEFLAHPLASVAGSQQVNNIRGGYVARGSFADKWVFAGVRRAVLGGVAGDALRAVVVVGDAPSPALSTLSAALLSLPISRVASSPLSTGPLFASHFYDLQSTQVPDVLKRVRGDDGPGHTGAPASNVEVLLKGAGTNTKETGDASPYAGRLWVRGPPVLERLGESSDDGWVDVGVDAAVATNGTFVVTK